MFLLLALQLFRFGFSADLPCRTFLENTWYVAREIPASLVGRRVGIRFENGSRARWNAEGIGSKDRDIVRPIDVSTGRKRYGLSPKVRTHPVIEGVLLSVEGRNFSLVWRRRNGMHKFLVFQEGVEWDATTTPEREQEVRPLDDDEILFTVRPELAEDAELRGLRVN